MFKLTYLRRLTLVFMLIALIFGADELTRFAKFSLNNLFPNLYHHTESVRGYRYRKEEVKFFLSSPAYQQKVDRSWRSVRTFPLMEPMRVPIHVYIDTPNSGLYKPQYASYVRDALNAWSNALDGNLRYIFVQNPMDAHIRFYWVTGFADDPFKAGEANYGIADARIRIKTVKIPEKEIKANIIHELGHVLGVGHSPNQGDIMVSFRKWNHSPNYEPHLSARDIAAIRLLYSPGWQRGQDLYAAIDQTNRESATR